MGENQACQSQVHVTALRCLRIKPTKRGLNRRLKPILQGGGGAGSHTLPNHVIRKWTVNMTLVKGYHAQTQQTARNFFMFHMITVWEIKTVHYYFSQVRFLTIQLL
jgi:hypothetical protein